MAKPICTIAVQIQTISIQARGIRESAGMFMGSGRVVGYACGYTFPEWINAHKPEDAEALLL